MLEDIEDSTIEHIMPRKTRQPLLNIQASIKTSLDMSTVPDRAPTAIKQCRICLEEETTPDNRLLAPCKCIGSVKYVHHLCYKTWIQKLYQSKDKREKSSMLTNGIECQMCKEKISIKFIEKRSCITYQKFKEKVRKNKFLFFLFLTFLIVNLACISYLIKYATSDQNQVKNSVIALSLIIGSFSFLGVTFIITLIYFVSDYFVDSALILESFQAQAIERPPVNNRYRVYPMSIEQLAQ